MNTSDFSTAPQTSTTMMTALFRNRADFDRAYASLSARGYDTKDVNVLMSDEARRKHFAADDSADKALEGAGVGSAVGGTVGAIVAAIAAIGTSLVLPGLGLVVAGPLAAALAGAGAGGLAGGLVGALVGSGVPEDRARVYETGLKEGGIVVGVRPRTAQDAADIEREWKTAHAEHVWR
ncbi:MAG: hypothetical protein U0324_30065 [Polyangiales bacterium]